ncbi:MAG: aminoacyl-tRNA hydrolase [Gammaproteobacteria bacterium]|nr:aminoacyl-tRNA hydrolase [Gammaproteobacteria bacterium]
MKQVILIRKDLKMRRGKEIAQGAHAAMAFLVSQLQPHVGSEGEISIELSDVERFWILHGMAKVCLQVGSEQALIACHEQAQQQGLRSHLIRDSGRTEFGGVPTYTACAIGPDLADRIDPVTGELPLY